MGGGDLNMKKSWHPLLHVNQERVWKKEKQALEERKKLEELRRERQQEREMQELQRLQEEAGGKKRTEKLDWMYATPAAAGAPSANDLEDYLLGKKRVDQMLKADESQKVSKTDQSSFISLQNANTARDTAAKIREDPMLAIKQQEQAAYEALLRDPTRLRQMRQKAGLAAEDGESKEERRRRKEEKRRRKEENRSGHEHGHHRDQDRERRREDERTRGRHYDGERRQSSRRSESRERDRHRHHHHADRKRHDDHADGSLSRRSAERSDPRDYPRRDYNRREYGRDEQSRSYVHDDRKQELGDQRVRDSFDERRRHERRDTVSPPPREEVRERRRDERTSLADRGRSRSRSPSPHRRSDRRTHESYGGQHGGSGRGWDQGPRHGPRHDGNLHRGDARPGGADDEAERRKAAERQAKLDEMMANAKTLDSKRSEYLERVKVDEAAAAAKEEELRAKLLAAKSKGSGDGKGSFLLDQQRQVLGDGGDLAERLRRGKGGLQRLD